MPQPQPQMQQQPQPQMRPQHQSSGFHGRGPKPQVPDDKPYYWANPLEALRRFFVKYADCSGRASRSEFWWAFAACALAFVLVCVAGWRHNVYTLAGYITLWFLVLGTPLLTLSIRRLHDTGQPESRVVFPLALMVDPIILLILMIIDSQSLELGSGIVLVFAWIFFLAPVQLVGSIWYCILMGFGSDPAGVRFDKGTKASGHADKRGRGRDGDVEDAHHSDDDKEVAHETVRSAADGAQGEACESQNEESEQGRKCDQR